MSDTPLITTYGKPGVEKTPPPEPFRNVPCPPPNILLLQGLSEPVRLRLVQELCRHTDSLTPVLLCTLLSLSSATVSHHLTILSHAGLVFGFRSGRNTLYSPNRIGLKNLAESLMSISGLNFEL